MYVYIHMYVYVYICQMGDWPAGLITERHASACSGNIMYLDNPILTYRTEKLDVGVRY